jgi:hypothetical protein
MSHRNLLGLRANREGWQSCFGELSRRPPDGRPRAAGVVHHLVVSVRTPRYISVAIVLVITPTSSDRPPRGESLATSRAIRWRPCWFRCRGVDKGDPNHDGDGGCE